jgi:hypothetical protein
MFYLPIRRGEVSGRVNARLFLGKSVDFPAFYYGSPLTPY